MINILEFSEKLISNLFIENYVCTDFLSKKSKSSRYKTYNASQIIYELKQVLN